LQPTHTQTEARTEESFRGRKVTKRLRWREHWRRLDEYHQDMTQMKSASTTAH
jgi:hypothetical protein